MEKKDVIECLALACTYAKDVVGLWHEKKLDQIRLKTANLGHRDARVHQNIVDQIKYRNKWNQRKKDDGSSTNERAKP